jgi:hypothetical protein
MKLLSSVAGGFAGALTVTILHQLLSRKYTGLPRPDLPAAQDTLKVAVTRPGGPARLKKPLMASTGAQLLASTLYFSLAGTRMKNMFTAGSLGGLMAGVGALSLPRKYHYNGAAVDAGKKHKWVTIALYLAGGLVSAMVIRWMERRNSRSQLVSPYNPPMESYKPVIDITV